ncbi:PqqD family protein [Szabonella alba]|uniref:PqqD family protein n=1 Tax=Szabonella alba TaxID=2804194 RepID=A0A8K0VDR8_9RHOB|nr:PqqD family protein [Szabonella alba]MBL4918343.1 PqqD family protein [Szabonella alba]
MTFRDLQMEATGGVLSRPSDTWIRLDLRGAYRPVILPAEGGLSETLLRCLRGWRVRRSGWDPQTAANRAPIRAAQGGPVLSLAEPRPGGRYRVHSAYTDAPLDDLPEASAACAVIADLAQAASAGMAGKGGIGLHCGAFEIGGRLIALTGAHRAGKSTLISRLTAETGITVFCDDVLALGADGTGRALGIAPRLRLPLPATVTPEFRAHVKAHLGPADDRYGYLLAPGLARKGRAAPLGAIVMLDRRPGAAGFHAMEPEDALRLLVEQSITDFAHAAGAYATAERILDGVPVLRLVYEDLEDAVRLLRRAFGGPCLMPKDLEIGPPLPPVAAEDGPQDRADPVDPDAVWRRAPGMAVRVLGNSAFLWWPGDGMLWQLNPTARAIWAMLELPGSARDFAEALSTLFPDIGQDRLEADCTLLMAELAAEGFIRSE